MSASEFMGRVGARAARPFVRPLWQAVYAVTGRRLAVQAHYYDSGVYGATFDAPLAAVRPRLPSGFEAMERRPGWTEITVMALDHRRIDLLAPYREVAITVPVRFQPFEGAARQGQLVLHLPVTTEASRWAGETLYGFPKTLASIDINAENGGRVCTLHEHGQHVFTLHVDAVPAVEASERFTHFTVRDGEVIESHFDLDGAIGDAERPGGVALELGYHAIADQLRALGLQAGSGRAFYAPALRARLGPPIERGRLPEALVRAAPEAHAGAPAEGAPPTTH